MIGWVVPLAVTLVSTLWMGLINHRLTVNRTGVMFAFVLGCFFFLLALLTAVGDDVHRNWGAHARTVAWNSLLMWKVLLYFGSSLFCVAAFLAYHQGISLSMVFIVLAIVSAVAAQKCFES
jgi:hypothetical protein